MNPTWKQNCPGKLAEERVGFCNIDQPRLGKITARIRARDSASRLRALAWTQLQRVVPCHNRNDKYNFLYKLKEKAHDTPPWSSTRSTLTNSPG
jgi:hypothetical protein